MEVWVRLLGTFREFSEETLHLRFDEEPKLGDVVQRLILELGPAFKESFLDPVLNSPLPRALILINGLEVGVLQGRETRLRDGDEVVILPIAHGG